MAKYQPATLSVKGGPSDGMTISLSEGPVLLGRGVDNDVDLYHETVSRRHALILETPDGYVLRDLASLNGTFVDRDRLAQDEHRLRHGDKIRLADSEVAFFFRERGAIRTKGEDEVRPSTETGDDSVELGGRLVQRARRLMGQLADAASGREAGAADEGPGEEFPDIQLGDKDAELLGLLESRQGTIVSKEDITRYVWPELSADSLPDRQILNAVGRLRAQIEENPRIPARLLTVKGHGYLLV